MARQTAADRKRLARNAKRRRQRAAAKQGRWVDIPHAPEGETVNDVLHADKAETTGTTGQDQQGAGDERVPISVGQGARRTYDLVNDARSTIKWVATKTAAVLAIATDTSHAEVTDNIVLAYRHLEDASMRLGKALQALDGGVSVYDRATTVGA